VATKSGDRGTRRRVLAWIFQDRLWAVDRALHEARWRDVLGGFRQFAKIASTPGLQNESMSIGGLGERVRRSYRRRAAERTLSGLDDHLLKDIGLARADIHAAAYGLLDKQRKPSLDSVASTESRSTRVRAVPGAC
jgi:uncharacterized protein YjiS (DUF1127 family)